jgi:hypothetical protein
MQSDRFQLARIAALAACLCFLIGTAEARADDCDDATFVFQTAQSEVDDMAKAYLDCVDASDGSDDCSQQFQDLANADTMLEQGVDMYTGSCP